MLLTLRLILIRRVIRVVIKLQRVLLTLGGLAQRLACLLVCFCTPLRADTNALFTLGVVVAGLLSSYCRLGHK